MPERNKDSLYWFVQIVYLIGFPLALLCILRPSCAYLTTYAILIKNIAGILVMALLVVFTHEAFKRRPELRRKLWNLGTALLFLCGFFFIFYSGLGVFCPYYGQPPYSASVQNILFLVTVATIFTLFLLGGFYVLYFGYVAKVNRIGLLVLGFIVVMVMLFLILMF